MRLTTPPGAGLGPPGGNGLLGEPHREASALTQGGGVLGPIRHPVPLLGNAMAAGGIGLEGHGRDLWSEAEQASTIPSRGYRPAHPCNKASATLKSGRSDD